MVAVDQGFKQTCGDASCQALFFEPAKKDACLLFARRRELGGGCLNKWIGSVLLSGHFSDRSQLCYLNLSTLDSDTRPQANHHRAGRPIEELADFRALQPTFELLDHQRQQALPDHGDDEMQSGEK